jgi:HSP20 family protein
MTLVPWRNKRKDGELAPLADLRHEMDRLFDAFMRDPMGSLSETFGSFRQWSPAIDVAEDQDQITVRAELPGIEAKDLDVSISGNQLTIAGEKRESQQFADQGMHLSESRSGSFRRTISLPTTVDSQQVTADFSNGVLLIRLKKTAEALGKRIEVRSN